MQSSQEAPPLFNRVVSKVIKGESKTLDLHSMGRGCFSVFHSTFAIESYDDDDGNGTCL